MSTPGAAIGRDEVLRHLQTDRFGRELVLEEETDSTNRLAAELARGGAVEGTVVVAEAQTAGRGRLGREWSSPAHRNIYCSTIVRPRLDPVVVPQLSLVAALAVVAAFDAEGAPGAEIKWPNDVLFAGRKAVGVLTELETDGSGELRVVIGIGLNVNSTAEDFPPELRGKATSVRLVHGGLFDRARLLARLMGELEQRYDTFLETGLQSLRAGYEARHALTGKTVRVEGVEPIEGVVLGIDDDGALRVDTGGRVVPVVAGEVTLRSVYGAG